jgi:hypothetical protein
MIDGHHHMMRLNLLIEFTFSSRSSFSHLV